MHKIPIKIILVLSYGLCTDVLLYSKPQNIYFTAGNVKYRKYSFAVMPIAALVAV